MKKLSILGSTGSIGTQTLEVVRANKDIEITALAAFSDVDRMEEQAREFLPGLICMYDSDAAGALRSRLADTDICVVSGMDGLVAAAQSGADIVLTAVVGMVGILPTLAAIEAGADIALANKETLVTAGHLVTAAVREKGVRLLPVDSEHSAIFQCIQGNKGNEIDRILLTCSGGPFRGKTRAELENVTVEDALRHPSWNMGKKITVDCATLANKGLEVMEAGWLFDVPVDRVQVVVHPGSYIHSMVQYADGAVMAQLGTPDMKLPIQYALYYPERRYLAGERLDLIKVGRLEFFEPDTETFSALALALEAGRTGGSMPTVFNAANEWAVARFLKHRIGFTDIAESIAKAMSAHRTIPDPSLEDILGTEQWVYHYLNSYIPDGKESR
ncbi:MAG: 1-deoxy-D-xylulose-5-phosphate reductoisomerase [Lachnospiraceae bacterium]|nr:1-deoxy-D-xylulose-5-phosphate reductoisomerase [Lachnospiraceae bacterium]